jgi:uncharacterized protein (DUF1684 family)
VSDKQQDEQERAAEYATALLDLHREKDDFFGDSMESPIPREQRGTRFPGLRYFAPDLGYRVEATLRRLEPPEEVQLGATRGDLRRQVRFAELRFTLDGHACRLTAFADEADEPRELFIPFHDATTGHDSYGAGRYLEVAYAGESLLVLDFNLAYSPWCAYKSALSQLSVGKATPRLSPSKSVSSFQRRPSHAATCSASRS